MNDTISLTSGHIYFLIFIVGLVVFHLNKNTAKIIREYLNGINNLLETYLKGRAVLKADYAKTRELKLKKYPNQKPKVIKLNLSKIKSWFKKYFSIAVMWGKFLIHSL